MPLRFDRLKEQRERQKMSQSELARRIKISLRQMGRYEQGKTDPPADTLARIVKVLGCTSDYLLGLTAHPAQYSAEIDPQALEIARRIMEFPEHTRDTLIRIVESMQNSGDNQ